MLHPLKDDFCTFPMQVDCLTLVWSQLVKTLKRIHSRSNPNHGQLSLGPHCGHAESSPTEIKDRLQSTDDDIVNYVLCSFPIDGHAMANKEL